MVNEYDKQEYSDEYARCAQILFRSAPNKWGASTIFQGIPFNLLLNFSGFLLIILLRFLVVSICRCHLRKPRHRDIPGPTSPDLPKLGFLRTLMLSDFEVAKYAGLDAVAFLQTLRLSGLQILPMTLFLIVGLPIYLQGSTAGSIFRRTSITNMNLEDKISAWLIWAITACSALAYLVITAWRLSSAYTWPRRLGVCRIWNNDSTCVDNSEAQKVVPEDRSPQSCQCNKVNQIVPVLMLSAVPNWPAVELERRLNAFFSSLDPPVKMTWCRPVRDYRRLLKIENRIALTETFLRIAQEQEDTNLEQVVGYRNCCFPCIWLCCRCCPRAPDTNPTKLNGSVHTNCCSSTGLSAARVYKQQLNKYRLNWFQECQRWPCHKDGNGAGQHRPMPPMSGVVFVGVESVDVALSVASAFSVYLQRAIPMDYTLTLLHDVDSTVGDASLPRQAGDPLRRLSIVTPSFFSTCGQYCLSCCDRDALRLQWSAPFGHLQLAPAPEELIWQNIMGSRYRSRAWWLIQVGKTVLIFMSSLLLTSPAYLVYGLRYLEKTSWYMSSYLYAQWIPALILVLAGSAVNQLVAWSEAWIDHATYGGREKVGQRTLYFFLLVTVFILPSVGLAGLPYLFMRIPNVLNNQNGTDSATARLSLECIFVPDSGGLFVNYVITSAFFGNAWQLLTVGYCFYWGLCCIFRLQSSAEFTYYTGVLKIHFPYRERYAFSMLAHTIVVAYSPISPIILIFGFLYFFCSYGINKWALLHIYSPRLPEGALVTVGKQDPRPHDPQPPPSRLYHLTWFVQASQLSVAGICMACLCVFLFCALQLLGNHDGNDAKAIASNKSIFFVTIASFCLLSVIGFLSIVIASPNCLPVWRRWFTTNRNQHTTKENTNDKNGIGDHSIDPEWYTPSFRHNFQYR